MSLKGVCFIPHPGYSIFALTGITVRLNASVSKVIVVDGQAQPLSLSRCCRSSSRTHSHSHSHAHAHKHTNTHSHKHTRTSYNFINFIEKRGKIERQKKENHLLFDFQTICLSVVFVNLKITCHKFTSYNMS